MGLQVSASNFLPDFALRGKISKRADNAGLLASFAAVWLDKVPVINPNSPPSSCVVAV